MSKTNQAILLAAGFGLLSLLFSLAAMAGLGFACALTETPNVPSDLSFAAGVSGPAIAGMLLARFRGEFRALLARITDSLPPIWVLAFPILFACVSWLFATASGAEIVWQGAAAMIASLLFHLFVISLFEETGWHGYLAPRLLNLTSPLKASMCVSLVWFAWHAPKFAIGWQYVAGAAFACIGLSIIATALLSLKRGAFPACVILHASANISQVMLDAEKASFSAQMWAFLATSALAIVLAGIVILRLGPRLGHPASD